MFSEEFQRRLSSNKYTQWACDLTEDHFYGLIWMVGEFLERRCGLGPIENQLEKYGSEPNLVQLTEKLNRLRNGFAICSYPSDDDKLAFSDKLRKRLQGGKYTGWAHRLTEKDLETNLRLLGEFAENTDPELKFLNRYPQLIGDPAFARARCGLEAAVRIVAGERRSSKETIDRIGKVVFDANKKGFPLY